ncbi:MAG: UMP kinase [Candidatus Dasytiphilus stammeri]
MPDINRTIYQRVLLKLSGEALLGTKKFGIDTHLLYRIAKEVKQLVELAVQIGIVIGGGNIVRGATLAKSGINRVAGDHMGMLATVINGLAILDALHRNSINAHLMSAIPLNGVCDIYSWAKAINLLKNQRVVIFCAGIGNPFFTTDSAACLRGIEIEANVILKATKVDGVFSADPFQYPNAILYEKITYQQVIEQELKIMDLAALTLARDYNIPIKVFNINKPGALHRIIIGAKEGTLIT